MRLWTGGAAHVETNIFLLVALPVQMEQGGMGIQVGPEVGVVGQTGVRRGRRGPEVIIGLALVVEHLE
jgi:hypothetical protein